MSCCGPCSYTGKHHFGYINNPGGYADRGFGFRCGCYKRTPCCVPKVTHIKCVTQVPECADLCERPRVFFHITNTFARLGAGCFKVILCPNTMENTNTKPVWLTDGKHAFPFIQAHTGDIIHYDQMVILCDEFRARRRDIVLDCYLGLDGPRENRVHILCRTRLPETTFIPGPDISGSSDEHVGDFAGFGHDVHDVHGPLVDGYPV